MIQEVVSGGQTGVDRAALDVAIQLGIPHGGWCPRGRRSEDGPIPGCYQLTETPSDKYPVRTARNIVESDATLILFRDQLHGGTKLTNKIAVERKKPVLLVDLSESPMADSVSVWLENFEPQVLNVAGPRESSHPGIYEQSHSFLLTLLSVARTIATSIER